MSWVLVIISGTSGAGKTVIAKGLARHIGDGQVSTITTRPRRQNESEDAYRFLSDQELDKLRDSGKTIWVAGYYGNRYSIVDSDIYETLESNKGVAFVAITPDYHSFLANWCKKKGIVPINFHLVSPDETEQRRRLTKRDGSYDERRIEKTRWFEKEATKASEHVPLIFIKQGSPEEMVHTALQYIFPNA